MPDDTDRRPGLPGQLAKLRRENEALAERVRLLESLANRQVVDLLGRVGKLEKRFERVRDYVGRIRRQLNRVVPPEQPE